MRRNLLDTCLKGENLRDTVGLEKQLNNVRYDWQGGENSIEHVD